MRSFTYTEHIDRAPERVWAYMMDLSKASRWRSLVRTAEIVTPGPLGVGSQLRVVFDVRGRTRALVTDVWSYEPCRRFGLRNTERNITGRFEYRLEPAGTGTRISLSCDIRPHGLMWLLLPFLIPGNRARYAQQLPNLKREVEREP
jgi:hypothetical protein